MPDDIFFAPPSEPVLYSPVLLWGLAVVRAIQSMESPGMTFFMSLLSGLGVNIIIPFVVVFYWCFDEKKSFRFGVLLVISAWVNSFLKDVFKQPRPFNLDGSLGIAFEPSFGLPSGHSQMSLVFAVFFALAYCDLFRNASRANLQKKIVWGTASAYILLIAFSRMYLGVHFPTDIAGGWLIGGILLAVFYTGEARISRLLETSGLRGQLVATALASFLMLAVYPKDTSLAALLLGFAGGYSLLKAKKPFLARGPINGKKPGVFVFFFRCVLGIAGAVILYIGLREIFPGGNIFENVSFWGTSSPYLELGRFIRYGILGLWLSAGAPLLFGNVNLAAGNRD